MNQKSEWIRVLNSFLRPYCHSNVPMLIAAFTYYTQTTCHDVHVFEDHIATATFQCWLLHLPTTRKPHVTMYTFLKTILPQQRSNVDCCIYLLHANHMSRCTRFWRPYCHSNVPMLIAAFTYYTQTTCHDVHVFEDHIATATFQCWLLHLPTTRKPHVTMYTFLKTILPQQRSNVDCCICLLHANHMSRCTRFSHWNITLPKRILINRSKYLVRKSCLFDCNLTF